VIQAFLRKIITFSPFYFFTFSFDYPANNPIFAATVVGMALRRGYFVGKY